MDKTITILTRDQAEIEEAYMGLHEILYRATDGEDRRRAYDYLEILRIGFYKIMNSIDPMIMIPEPLGRDE